MLNLLRPRKSDIFVFKDSELQTLADVHKHAYQSNEDPFSHTVIDNFLPDDVAERLLSAFPPPDAPCWIQRGSVYQPGKQGIGRAERLEGAPPFIHNMLMALNAYPVLHFLETLTGIRGLLPDPYFNGGGIHQILPGGKLDVHCDFNFVEEISMVRRLNLILYLNKDWKEEYAGYLELWDKSMTQCVKKIEPRFNRCVIFTTDRYSYHGHPVPLACPAGMTRKSLALYYYVSPGSISDTEKYDTIWQKPPENA